MYSKFKNLSISTKINLVVLLVFVMILIASISHMVHSERVLIENIVQQQNSDTADTYFDAINTMMLTGTMDKRDILRNKILERPGITDARILRGEAIKTLYGEGLPEGQARDELDNKALNGQIISQIDTIDGERILTVINPVRAMEDYRGTNCLSCHANAKTGDVVGAVRISYSLKQLDSNVNKNLLNSTLIHIALFGLGLALLMFTLRQVIGKPLKSLHHTIDNIDQNADLNQRVKIFSEQDDIGQVGTAFNNMLQKIHDSLSQVLSASQQLTSVATDLTSVSEETVNNVALQRNETDQAAAAMNEMTATTQEISNNATETASTSEQANKDAQTGAYVSTEALGSIDALLNQLKNAAQKITELDAESNKIGIVLDVITKIAEQTNLLALNAAIEAARAGEQGRGFAVVADEVRTLAARSQESATQIQKMVESLQAGARNAVSAMENARKQAEDSSEKVEQAAESLGMIAGEIADISERNAQIASAAEQQSSVMEESNQNLSNISDATHRTSSGAEQTASYSEKLLQLAQHLEQQVQKFKL
ncbi:MAG: methyl-accepting chemotaxis protein [Gammaproteobacteria bacterium]|nr:methyl-accepting chemotaxis protein [Gammaproteobacteria bacterium]